MATICAATGCVMTVCLPNLLQALPSILKYVKCQCKCSAMSNDFGIVLFEGQDRTALINNLVDEKQRILTVFLDLDQLVWSALTDAQRTHIQVLEQRSDYRSILTIILPKAIEIRKALLATYKNKRILWFSSYPNLFHFMEMRRVFCFLPTGEMERELFRDADQTTLSKYGAHRSEVYRSEWVPYVYNTRQSIGEQLCQIFRLTYMV